MKKLIILIFAFMLSLNALAQLEVKQDSFHEIPGFINKEKKLDNNENPCALVIIKTANITDKQRRDLHFSGDAATYIEVEYKEVGSVWVYLSHVASFLKIKHKDLSYTEFAFPYELNPKSGYELTLVNNAMPVVEGWGSLTVTTKPENGASIWLNKKPLQQKTPYTNEMLSAGKYEITVSKERYKPFTEIVEIKAGETKTVELVMPTDVALITLKTDANAEIYIDGSLKTKGTWTGELKSGSHEIICKKQYHTDAKQSIVVEAGVNKTYELNPKPIYGSISISSTPTGSTIILDGQKVGTTPKEISDVLIGSHNVRVEKDGYNAETTTLTVYENKKTSLNMTLTYGREITIETSGRGDKVFIDGKDVGTAPIKQVMSYGRHTISAYNGVKSAYRDFVVQKGTGSDRVYLQMVKETLSSYAKTGYKFFTLDISMSQYGNLSYGLTLGAMKKFGFFVSAATNFNFETNFDYECDNEHFVGEYYPEYTGTESYSSLSVMGGLLMRIGGPVAMRVGAGYGMRMKRYETISGYWVKNKAISGQGVDVLLGLQCNFRGFIVSIDCVTNNFSTYEAKIGLGLGLKNR